MSRVLVTGGTGEFGREVVARLKATKHIVRVMSRSAARPGQAEGVEWAQANMETGAGLTQAVQDVDIIINAASDPLGNTYQSDVVGTQRLLEQAKAAGVKHALHISIVGIEKIPYPYYHYKLGAEQVVIESGVPYSILRATQFHTLLDMIMNRTRFFAGAVVPFPSDAQVQLIDVREVVNYLLPYITEKPAGRIPDVGGPEVLTVSTIARMWMQARGFHGVVLNVPMLRELGKGFRAGYNCVPERKYGAITWAHYLQRKYGANYQVVHA